MFKKTQRTWLTATNAFVVAMLTAILEEQLGTRVYLTQTLFKRAKRAPIAWIKNVRRFAVTEMTITVDVFFISVDFPRRHGVSGISTPVLPKAEATFCFTNNSHTVYNWELLDVLITWKDHLDPDKRRGEVGGYFEDIHCKGLDGLELLPTFSEPIRELAEEFRRRGPSRSKND